MRTAQTVALACILLAGCISLPENVRDHDERVAFVDHLVSDVRVASILAHKPNSNIFVLGDSRALIIFVNSPEVVTVVSNGPDIVGPGNQYTQAELAVIENVALELRTTLGIRRDIVVFDDTAKKEHRARHTAEPGH